MTAAGLGQLNLEESTPIRGSRSVDCFEKLEQIGEGTYGYPLSTISLWFGFCGFHSLIVKFQFLSIRICCFYVLSASNLIKLWFL